MAFTDKVGAYLQVGATNFLDLSTCVGRRLVLSLHTSMLLDGSEGGPRRMVLLETSILTLLGRRREPQGYPGLVTALVTHSMEMMAIYTKCVWEVRAEMDYHRTSSLHTAETSIKVLIPACNAFKLNFFFQSLKNQNLEEVASPRPQKAKKTPKGCISTFLDSSF